MLAQPDGALRSERAVAELREGKDTPVVVVRLGSSRSVKADMEVTDGVVELTIKPSGTPVHLCAALIGQGKGWWLEMRGTNSMKIGLGKRDGTRYGPRIAVERLMQKGLQS